MFRCYRLNIYLLIYIAVYNNIYICLSKTEDSIIRYNTNNNCYSCFVFRLKPTSTGKFKIKPKTNKSILKRFKITGSGKLMHKRSGIQHLRSKLKSRQRCRLKRPVIITSNRLRTKYLQAMNIKN